jgi:hypothetical protein
LSKFLRKLKLCSPNSVPLPFQHLSNFSGFFLSTFENAVFNLEIIVSLSERTARYTEDLAGLLHFYRNVSHHVAEPKYAASSKLIGGITSDQVVSFFERAYPRYTYKADAKSSDHYIIFRLLTYLFNTFAAFCLISSADGELYPPECWEQDKFVAEINAAFQVLCEQLKFA